MIGARANTVLLDDATQFIVTEAKLFSPLSRGVTHARYFDQAARTVACMAEMLCKAKRHPEQFKSLSFVVLAPQEQIDAHLFSRELSTDSIEGKVRKRVSEYPFEEKRDEWLRDWFEPTLRTMTIECLSWEKTIEAIHTHDKTVSPGLSDFYDACQKFNRDQEPGVSGETPID